MNSRRIVIAGGSGFLGSAASRFFAAQHYEVVVLSRFRHEDHDGIRYMLWDGRTPADWTAVLEGALALINFSGRSIDCRFTPENRREILESRINSVEALFEAAGRCVVPPFGLYSGFIHWVLWEYPQPVFRRLSPGNWFPGSGVCPVGGSFPEQGIAPDPQGLVKNRSGAGSKSRHPQETGASGPKFSWGHHGTGRSAHELDSY